MFVIVACEYSNIVATAFRSAGHFVLSVDIIPNDVSQKFHVQADILEVLKCVTPDLLIAHPPCTYLCKAQMFRYYSESGRLSQAVSAALFVDELFFSAAPLVAIENPSGFLNWHWRSPDQIIYPWRFGDGYSKDVCLWLKNLPPLIDTCVSTGRRPVSNHVNSKMSQALKSKIKSRFFPGIAAAMASQWSLSYCYFPGHSYNLT